MRPDLYAEPDTLRVLLREARTVAVVGLSPRKERPSNFVARRLQDVGYRVVPVNPKHLEILGERCYASLGAAAKEHTIDVVDVFRRSQLAGQAVNDAIAISPRLIWLQIGVIDDAAADRANAVGIPIVMNRCLAVEHQRLGV